MPPPLKISLDSSQELNWRYQNWCVKNGREQALRFGRIREFYSNYHWADLAKHPAAVIFPHSAYSITIAELYEMNIPLFVPSVEVMLKNRMPGEVIRHHYRGTPHPQSTLPQSLHDNGLAMARWLRFCYFYQKENAIVWDSPDDLFRKLSEYDLADISEKMYRENKASRKESLRRWGEVLNQHRGV